MFTPCKLIAFLTLALILSSTPVFADCVGLGSGWVQGTSSGGVDVCVPTGDNPTGAISSGTPVLTQNGKEYYAPPSSMADKLIVDSTGRIGRTLDEVTRITRADGSVYIYTTSTTFYTEAGAASTSMWDKIKADPTSFPTLAPIVSALPMVRPTTVGTVIPSSDGNLKVTSVASSVSSFSNLSGSTVGQFCVIGSGAYKQVVLPTSNVYPNYLGYLCAFTTTSDPVTPLAPKYSDLPAAVAASGAAGASEIDKLIAQNPDSFKKSYTPSATEGITAPPIPTALTPEKIAEIYAGNGAPKGTGSPTIGPGGIPTLAPPVEVPQPGPGGGDPDPTQPPAPPDIYGPGYTPGFNGAPYGRGAYDPDFLTGDYFGNRLAKFMSDLKGTSLFSLPTSILSNIPGSGTSAISFDGGEFGQQSFDFAAFSNQLMIIRSVLLLCFSLLAIRIVTLKR